MMLAAKTNTHDFLRPPAGCGVLTGWNRSQERRVSACMSLAGTLSLNIAATGARSERYQPDLRRTYPTSRGTPAVNLPSNTPPDREGGSRRQWPAERRPEAPETDWPALVRRCLDGDSGAWTELVAAQQRRVYALCYRFTASSHDAEDLTQDVFIKLYGNLASFDAAKGSFQTWITTLTRNLLVDHFRRSRQQRVTDSMDLGWEQGNTTRLLRGKRELRVGQILAILKVLEVEPLAFYTSVHGDRSLATRVVAGLSAPPLQPLLLPPAMSEEEFSRRVREAVLQALAAREQA